MKIHTFDGKVIDTDKLTDKEADSYRALNEFYKVCEKYDVAMVTRIILNPQKYAAAQTVPQKVPKKQKEMMVTFLLDTLGLWVEKVTDGKVRLFRVEE